ncbi:hypothetical protein BB559_006719 [Furculomyces boomerangus]|uniref:Uncharacterized protein n=1 Tax=Furculomyces boomerangus TaxID=61424 RepID=A0A2T9Y0W0_9FUNG|nr:hypothetical protein BB559_006719 [Furculomyces boomerangus]
MLDVYTLENIFILSGNPEISTLSMKLFRVTNDTRTQMGFLIRNVYPTQEFLQSIFYSKYPGIAKKEELTIEQINNGIDINKCKNNSILNRAFRYGLNDTLDIILKKYKKVEIYCGRRSKRRVETDFIINHTRYKIEPLIPFTSIMEIINEHELYKDQNMKTLQTVLKMGEIELDLVGDCGIPAESLNYGPRKINLYRNMNKLIDFDELIIKAIQKDQPVFTKYVLEYEGYSENNLKRIYNTINYSTTDTKNNKSFAILKKCMEKFE